ncbi:MAG TPA: PKD domain-containing protein [Bacteroidales bacterium]|nr:PKD domain-containing protein [Bacteroidales bacterium]
MKKFLFSFSLILLTISVIAQELPQAGPINPEFLEYLAKKNSGELIIQTEDGYYLGEIPSPFIKNFDNFSFNAPKLIPSSYDLRYENGGDYLTSVKNQGAEGACWSFATYAAVESYWKKQGLATYDLSEQNLATCHAYDYTPSQGGNSDMSAAYLTRFSGPISESDDPYTLPSNPTCVPGFTPVAYVGQYRELPGKASASYDENAIKQAVLDYGVIYTNMYYESSYKNATDHTYYYNGSNGTNHAVAIVGWDDDMVVTGGSATPSGPGAWIIKNSWGTSWGVSGFFYISYEDTKVNSTLAYFPSYIEYDPNAELYFYDDYGATGSYGWVDGDDYALVKYEATQDMQITKLGSFVTHAGTGLSFWVYDSFDGSNLTGLLGSISENTCELPGYYTYDLSTPINISSGEDFYIKARYNSGQTATIPRESIVAGYTSAATIQTGKCWLSNLGTTSWLTIGGGTSYMFDVCINAYTVAVASAPPTADFSADQTVVVAGTTVNFSDASSGVPEDWTWTFEGGDPATSDIYNPSVTYNTPGTYDVTLYVSNGFGFDEITKENYITVSSAPLTCEYYDNIEDSDVITAYTMTGGYLTGPSNAQYTEFAEYYDSPLNFNLEGVRLGVYQADVLSGDPKITIKVWDVDAGLPGTELYTEDFNIGDFTASAYNNITFASNTIVPSEFFIGYQIYYTTPQDTFAIYQALNRGSGSPYPNTAYIKKLGVWHDADYYLSGTWNTAFTIYPKLCPSAPTADFTADVTSGCTGLSVQFTQNCSSNTDTWEWDFGDGTPTSTEANPSHTYTASGTYTVSLTASNTTGNDTETKVDYIYVAVNPATVIVSGGGTQCAGSMTITADNGGDGTIYWQNTTSGGTSIANPSTSESVSASGTYYFRAQSAEGCWGDEGSAVVTINSLPADVIVSGGGSQCGGSMTLTADNGGDGTIYWQNTTSGGTNIANPSISESVSASGTYYFRAQSAEGCWGNEGSAVVTINAIPDAVAVSGGGTQCGGSMTLTASGGDGGTIYWQNTTSGGTSIATPSTSESVSVSGTYYFRARSTEGCWGPEDSETVTINLLPADVIVSGGGSQCGGSMTLTADNGGDGTIYWQNTISGGTSIANPSISESVPTSGTYYFRAQSAEGCWGNEGSAVVTINAIPDAVAVSGGGTQCGGSMTLTASGGDGGTIYWQNTTSGGTSIATPSTSESVSVSGTYYFRARSTEGCWGPEDSETVTINLLPADVIVSGGGSQCGGSMTLTADNGGDGTIYWQNTTSGGISIANPSTSESISSDGTYYFRAQSAEGCWGNEGSASVTIYGFPDPVIISGGGTQCGGSMTLTASGGDGGTIYWQNTTSGGTSIATPSTSESVSASGTYYFRSRSVEGCWGDEDSETVTINLLPADVIVSGGGSQCGGSMTLTADNGGDGTIYWQNTISGGTSIANPSTSESVPTSGTYYFRAQSAEGCWGNEGSESVTIYDIPDPVIVSGGGTQCGGSMTLTASGGDGGTIYWQNTTSGGTSLANPSTFETVSVSGTYYFRSYSADGCWGDEGSETATINLLPAEVIVSGDGTQCGGSMTLNADNGGDGTIYWQNTTSGGTSIANPSTSETVSASGIYYFRAISSEGCWGNEGAGIVTINDIPDPVTVLASGNLCDGFLTLTASGGDGGTIYWQNTTSGGTSTAIESNSETVSVSGTYYFRSRSTEGCWGDEGSETVTITPLPTQVVVTGGGTQCGGTMTLTADNGGDGTIYWQNTTSGGTSIANPSTSETVSASGIYYFRAISSEGCWGNEGAGIVTINDIPDPVIVTGGGTQCGGSMVLSASGGDGGTIYWQSTTSGGTSITNPSTSESASVSGTYYFRSRSAEGCWGDEGSASVTINDIPADVIVSGGGTQCGGSMTLTADNGDEGTIYWQNTTSGGTNVANPSTSETVAVDGTYYFRARSAEGCWGNEGSASVTILDLPNTVIVSGGASQCGGTVTLSADNGSDGTIYWQNTTSGGTSIANPSTSETVSESGTYYFRAQSVDGCWGDEGASVVEIFEIPEADDFENVTACGSYILPEVTTGNYFTTSGGIGLIAEGTEITSTQTIFVYAETGTTPNCTDETSFTVTINDYPVIDDPEDVSACDVYILPALTNGEYFAETGGVNPITTGTEITSTQTIYVYAESGTTPNCTVENSFVVTINTAIPVDLGDDIEQCGGPVELDAGAGYVSYEWNGTPGNQTFLANTSGTYTVVVEDNNGCTATDEIEVTIFPALSFSLSSTNESAPGANDGSITVEITGGTPDYYIDWISGNITTSSTSYTITGLTGGNYGITVVDSNGCSDTDGITVNTDGVAPVTNFTANVTEGCDNLTVTFTDLSSNTPTSWAWDFGDGDVSIEQNPVHEYTSPGLYTISLTAGNAYGDHLAEFEDYIIIGETPTIDYMVTSATGEFVPDGAISVTVTGGQEPYIIEWAHDDEETSLELLNLMPGDYYLTVTEDLVGCQSTEHIVVDFVNIIISETISCKIYPNPASDVIFIEFENGIPENIEIVNTLGEIVFVLKPENYSTIININNYTPGNYFINLYYTNSVHTHKIVIK